MRQQAAQVHTNLHPISQLRDIGCCVQHAASGQNIGILCQERGLDNSAPVVGAFEVGILTAYQSCLHWVSQAEGVLLSSTSHRKQKENLVELPFGKVVDQVLLCVCSNNSNVIILSCTLTAKGSNPLAHKVCNLQPTSISLQLVPPLRVG